MKIIAAGMRDERNVGKVHKWKVRRIVPSLVESSIAASIIEDQHHLTFANLLQHHHYWSERDEKMNTQAILRARMATQLIARRGFSSTVRRADNFSPYHYPEGPYTNLPFNTKTRFFWLRYWGFMCKNTSDFEETRD
ncbi:hypothetical protein AYO21_05799 [Fonsecaea monophora]|uniref:Uncharacterized protein n=1 Tax=Fonsecaea monophora TaxID=254056 RepID=A0A177F840_9EURO|nr:hypothetical protein AYO21_05799 [Fonsecaea monophora]KAH0844870.1 hypothetical protein FOPE_10005 [Fonsecaea pedrosoi]OAG39926.1 hypothetical protein AYO21_05799 [Fonsecaea monophora]